MLLLFGVDGSFLDIIFLLNLTLDPFLLFDGRSFLKKNEARSVAAHIAKAQRFIFGCHCVCEFCVKLFRTCRPLWWHKEGVNIAAKKHQYFVA